MFNCLAGVGGKRGMVKPSWNSRHLHPNLLFATWENYLKDVEMSTFENPTSEHLPE